MKKKLMKGNEAIAEAAIQAGCKLFFGYPITPSTELIEYMSWRLKEVGGTFIQAESEVAAINMVYGAGATGVRAMTGSSGPGISLMQEGLSYIAAADVPCLLVDVMRAGPGIGGLGPTQADYYQATRGGGHGDYRSIVLAPATVQEAVDLVQIGFDLADLYRMNVILAIDSVVGQMMEPVEFRPVQKRELPPKTWAVTAEGGRPRNIVGSSDGLNPALFEQINFRRQAKYEEIMMKEQMWEDYYTEDADYIIVAYGTCARIVKGVVQQAREEGIKVGLIRPITLWPFPTKAFEPLLDRVKGILCVELSAGQMMEDVRLAINCKLPVYLHWRSGGLLPSSDGILADLKNKVIANK